MLSECTSGETECTIVILLSESLVGKVSLPCNIRAKCIFQKKEGNRGRNISGMFPALLIFIVISFGFASISLRLRSTPIDIPCMISCQLWPDYL